MTEQSTPSRAAISVQSAFGVPTALTLALLLLGALAMAWIAFMIGEWRENPDLSHGLLAPVLFAVLIREARTRGTRRYLRSRSITYSLLAAFLVSGLMILTLAGLIAAALAWSNALTAFLLGTALTLLALGALVACSHVAVRLVPFNWPAVVACLLGVLSAPIPPGTYSRLTVTLQLWVTHSVLYALQFFGVPAQQQGNVIQLATTSVGVEQACSGVRSLVSCVVAALFLSAILLRTPWARFVVVALAAPLAIAMNFLRSLALTLAANHGIEIGDTLHEITGFAVLGLTAALLAGLTMLLERGRRTPDVGPDLAGGPEPVEAASAPGTDSATHSQPGSLNPIQRQAWSQGPVLPMLVSAALAVAIAGFFAVRTQPAPHASFSAPNFSSLLPGEPEGWNVQTSPDLYQFSATLKTSHLLEQTYRKNTVHGPLQVTVYLAYWFPGQAPVSLVSSHTPDACWPGAGWTAQSDVSALVALTAHRAVRPAEYRSFRHGDSPQHVWFWHLYRGEPVLKVDPFSPMKMAGLVLRYGVRSEAEQLFVRISSNQRWEAFADEPLIKEIIDRLQPLGL